MSEPTANLINVLPAPTSKSPLVYVVYPVPPYKPVMVVPVHTPVVIVPKAVREELVTPVPKELAESTAVLFIL